MTTTKIRIAIVGVGNCASSLVQGINFYRHRNEEDVPGVMFPNIGGYKPWDIEVVAAFDVDERKVGAPLSQAIFAGPNCARVFHTQIDDDVIVQAGPRVDGVADHMRDYHKDINFQPVDVDEAVDVVQVLKDTKADILINYLPVGSEVDTRVYAQMAIDAGVAFLNCIPVFIASDPVWEQKFIDAGLPLIGDDMRSQIGASVLSQVLQELAFDRGAKVLFHQQLNVGGNSDFANMMEHNRLKNKKISKENVIRAQNDIRGIPLEEDTLYAGPSTFIPYLKDNKVAYFNLRLEAFGGAPIDIDIKLSVQDSENSAGVVIDAVRYLKVARELGVVGALRGPSAWTQKTPPEQMMYADAKQECIALANRELTDSTKDQVK